MHSVKEVRTIDSATLTLSLPSSFLRKQVEITVRELRPASKSRLARLLSHPIKVKGFKKFSREELNDRESLR